MVWQLRAASTYHDDVIVVLAIYRHEEGQGEQTKVTARALYDFTPQREDELGFSAGEELVSIYVSWVELWVGRKGPNFVWIIKFRLY